MRPAVISFLPRTHSLARKIAEAVEGDAVVCTAEELTIVVRKTFSDGQPLIAICASGILVKLLASLLDHKHRDPPVVAVSGDGMTVVPLLGGHHGANDLARKIAAATGGRAAITTATDLQFGANLEEPPGHTLANPEDMKDFLAAALAGASVRVQGDAQWLGTMPRAPEGELSLTITDLAVPGGRSALVYHPHTLAVGVGCERNVEPAELIGLIESALAQGGLARQSIACLVSIDLKTDEQAVHAAARHFGVAARFFTGSELNEESSRLKNPSAAVLRETGCPGVSEGAALRAAGKDSQLVVEKLKSEHSTCAIARSGLPIDPNRIGRKRGKLSVVGVGPGTDSWRSPEARQALIEATDWVGYDRYIDLVADLHSAQEQHRFRLGEEEARARYALHLADEGRDVALVCSGDSGIYAMASIVFELADPSQGSRHRCAIEVIPGISAFQAAAARSGALMGHDFCAISLSDLLTPWPVIEKRIRAAAEADFVIAFYNPRSPRRTAQLQRAIEILTPCRAANTPVVIATNVGRHREKISVIKLADFKPEEVDMLTLVLVGSTASRIYTRGDGQTYAYTPRGYELKREVAS